MKRTIVILLILSAMLTGCSNAVQSNVPAVTEATEAVSHETSAKEEKASQTTTGAVTVQPSEVTTASISSDTAAVTTAPQSKPTASKTTSAETDATTVSEKKTATAKQTSAVPNNTTTAKKAAAEKQTDAHSKDKTTAKQATVTEQTTAKQVTTIKQTTTVKQTTTSAKETVVDISRLSDQMWAFIADYPIDCNAMYEQGKKLQNLSDYDKAAAVTKIAYEHGGVNCIEYALNTYFLAKGAGLHCYIARSSKYGWYGHVANIAEIDGKFYYIEPQGNIVGSPYTFASGEGGMTYPDGLDIVTDIYGNRVSVTIADDWYC